VFRLKEIDKGIEKSLDTFAALDRSLDKLPAGSTIMIRDQDVQIAVWKAGHEPTLPTVVSEAVVVRVPGVIPATGVRLELSRPGDGTAEAG
jgi:hypothetical protein